MSNLPTLSLSRQVEIPKNPIDPPAELSALTGVKLTLAGGLEIKNFQLTEGETARLYAVAEPIGVPVVDVIWEENEFVQVVESDTQSALYRAIRSTKGEAKTASVRVKAAEGDYVAQNVSFEILRFVPELKSLTIQADKSLDDLGYREEVQLTAIPNPADAEYETIIWSTSNHEAVEVNADTGKVVVNDGGLAVITAMSGEAKGQIEIYSKHYALTELVVTDSIGSAGPYDLTDGDQVRLFAIPKPAQTELSDVKWGSSEFVRLVSDDGESALYEAAKTTDLEVEIPVLASSAHGRYVGTTIRFSVSKPPSIVEPTPKLTGIDLKLSRDPSEIEYMGQAQLIATPVPEGAEFQSKFVWASDNPNAVEVSPSGVITMKNAGVAQITAKCGDVTQTITLTSSYYALESVAVTSLAGAVGTHEVEPGAQIKFVATTTPPEAAASYQWTSNQYVTLISQDGNTATYEAIEVTERVTTGGVTDVTVTATGTHGGSSSTSITIKVPKVK